MIIHDACNFCKCQISINSLSSSRLFMRSHKNRPKLSCIRRISAGIPDYVPKSGEIPPVWHFRAQGPILQFIIIKLANRCYAAYHYAKTALACIQRGGVCLNEPANGTMSSRPAAAKEFPPLYKEKEIAPAASSADKAAWIAFPAQCQRKDRPAGAVRDMA